MRLFRSTAVIAAIHFILFAGVFTADVAVAAAPLISGTPSKSATLGVEYRFRPAASDADGGTLQFSIVNKPAWMTFSTTTGELRGVPYMSGTFSSIRIAVSDGTTTTQLPQFNIATKAAITLPTGVVNRPPTISGAPTTAWTVGKSYSFKPTASDPDGHALKFVVLNRPWWATFNATTGQLSGIPTTATINYNIVIAVTDGITGATLPAYTIRVTTATTPTNTAPTIAGSPIKTIAAGTVYSFTPVAADANGDMLAFSIANKPAWATFSTTTGRLSGTPTTAQIGNYANIVISVSDGKTTTALPAFAIAVTTVPNKSITLNWSPPSRNTDGTTVTNLAGYRIQYGTSASALNQTIQVANSGISSYVIDNLAPATYYFAVRAYTISGMESSPTNVVTGIVQ